MKASFDARNSSAVPGRVVFLLLTSALLSPAHSACVQKPLAAFVSQGTILAPEKIAMTPEADQDCSFGGDQSHAPVRKPDVSKELDFSPLTPENGGRPREAMDKTAASLAGVDPRHIDFDALPRTENATDLSPSFLEIHRRVRENKAGPLSKDAWSLKYLFVRGFMGNHIENYMQDNVARLKNLGLDADFIEIETEGGRERNLRKINAAVKASDKPVVLIGHSRGGVHVHDWYRSSGEDMKAKVEKLVLMQAPLEGSEAADFVLDHALTRLAARLMGFLPGWGDVLGTVEELSTSERKRAMDLLPPFLPEDLKKMTVFYASFDPSVHSAYHRDMELSRSIIEGRGGGASDGLVSVHSARMPGASFVYLTDLDHEDTVLEHPGWFKRILGSRPNPDFHVGDVSEALVRLLLSDSMKPEPSSWRGED